MDKFSASLGLFSEERWPAIAEAAKSEGATDWQVRKWRTRRCIPGTWHLKLLKACKSQMVFLSSDELLSTQSQRAA